MKQKHNLVPFKNSNEFIEFIINIPNNKVITLCCIPYDAKDEEEYDFFDIVWVNHFGINLLIDSNFGFVCQLPTFGTISEEDMIENWYERMIEDNIVYYDNIENVEQLDKSRKKDSSGSTWIPKR